MERENLFTKKQEKVYFQHAADEAKEQGKMAVLLKGFDNSEKNLLLDERAMKIKQASREHTIQGRQLTRLAVQDWNTKCLKLYVNEDVVEEWSRVAGEMNKLGKGPKGGSDDVATEMMALLEGELKTVHDVMGKKWREAHGKEASVRKAFAILFACTMVFETEESWLLYASNIKAAINKQFKAFGASWKKVLHNDLEHLGLSQEQLDTVLEKLAAFDAHINHIEGVDIKFGYK